MKKGLEMEILGELEIALPYRIATTKLTLEQIGLIVCLTAMGKAEGDDQQVILERFESAEMKVPGQALYEMGVLKHRKKRRHADH